MISDPSFLQIIAVLSLVLGLLILFRRFWYGQRDRASTQAEKRVRDLLRKEDEQDAEQFAAEGKSKAELQKTSPLVNRLAKLIDDSQIIQDEEAQSFLDNLDKMLIRGGLRDRFSPTQALAYAMVIWALGVLVPMILIFTISFPKIPLIVAAVFAALYPILKLRQCIQERQDAIRAEVPFFIQQLYMTLSSGMATIDEAIIRVGRTAEEDPYDSILAAEFGQAQVEYRLGAKTFEQSLRDIGRRTGVISVENLCEAMIQGYRTGTEMDKVLLDYSNQAQEMWRQDMRAYKNRKEPMVTIGLVMTMFGAFILWSTPLIMQLVESLNSF